MKFPSFGSANFVFSVLSILLSATGFGLVLAQNTNVQAWIAPARAARKENPIRADAKSIAEGKELYVMACLPCHGASGRGDGPAAATLERNGVRVRPGNLSDPKMWLESDGALFWKMTQGNTPMPAFGETFADQQRWTVINYVRTLAPREIAGSTSTDNKIQEK